MAKFQYAPSEEDRAYVLVDDIFDISLLQVEEGLIFDVYANDEFDCVGTLAVEDPCEQEA